MAELHIKQKFGQMISLLQYTEDIDQVLDKEQKQGVEVTWKIKHY